MEQSTSIARGVRSATNDYDAACKRLLSEKQILSRILKGCLNEFSHLPTSQIEQECLEGEPRIGTDAVTRDDETARVRALSNEDKTLLEGTTFFDIRFTARVPVSGQPNDAELVRLELNVEAQSKFSPGYPLLKRGIFYAGRLLSMQGDDVVRGSHYERLRKVASLWVCAHPKREYRGTITSFGLEPHNLLGCAHYDHDEYDLAQIVMLCLNDKDPGSSGGVLGMLEVLLATGIGPQNKLNTLHNDYGIIITRSVEERMGTMGSLGEYFVEECMQKGMQQGMQQGMQKGMQQGMQKGMQQSTLEHLRSLMRSEGWSVSRAMDALMLPQDERASYLKMLQE